MQLANTFSPNTFITVRFFFFQRIHIHQRQSFLKEHSDANKESNGQSVDIDLRKCNSSLSQFRLSQQFGSSEI